MWTGDGDLSKQSDVTRCPIMSCESQHCCLESRCQETKLKLPFMGVSRWTGEHLTWVTCGLWRWRVKNGRAWQTYGLGMFKQFLNLELCHSWLVINRPWLVRVRLGLNKKQTSEPGDTIHQDLCELCGNCRPPIPHQNGHRSRHRLLSSESLSFNSTQESRAGLQRNGLLE